VIAEVPSIARRLLENLAGIVRGLDREYFG
jgi:hypothetical protein